MGILDLLKKKNNDPKCSVVIVAAGNSERMGSDKILAELGRMPVIVRTMLAFERSAYVDEIIVVTREDKIETIAKLCSDHHIEKVSSVITGGKNRTESALAGVLAVRKGAKLIAVHDGARPLVTEEIIRDTVLAAQQYTAAVPVVKSTDTLKTVDADNYVTGTLDREKTMRVQTPQVFDADIIKGALTYAFEHSLSLTDDSMAVELMGFKVMTVKGSEENIKLTNPQDMKIAEQILENRGEYIADRPWL